MGSLQIHHNGIGTIQSQFIFVANEIMPRGRWIVLQRTIQINEEYKFYFIYITFSVIKFMYCFSFVCFYLERRHWHWKFITYIFENIINNYFGEPFPLCSFLLPWLSQPLEGPLGVDIIIIILNINISITCQNYCFLLFKYIKNLKKYWHFS